MDDAPILICYDGSADSDRAIEAAAVLLGPRRAVVVDIGPTLTAAESVAAVSAVVPGNAFEDLNMNSALEKARAGAGRAREAGFKSERGPSSWSRSGRASSTWRTRSTRP